MTNQELLKIYSAYLPYGVKVVFEGEELEHSLVGLDITSTPLKLISPYGDYGQASFEFSKLVLRPLSDLTKEIEHNGERFYPIGKLHNSSYRRQGSVCKSEYEVNEMIPGIITTKKSSFSQGVEVYLNRVDNNKQWIINYLLKWHFDVFGLIEKGLAININDLKDEKRNKI